MKLTSPLTFGLAVLLIIPGIGYAFDENDIREIISGNTIHMYHKKKDVKFTRFFSEDGVLFENHSEKGFRKGHWRINDTKLCFTLDDGQAKCRPFMEKDGEYGTGNKKGKMMVIFENIEKGNHIVLPKNPEEAENSSAVHEELVTIKTREDVTQTFLLFEPKGKPKGVVVLYPGHEGVVRFTQIGNKYDVDNEGGGLTANEKSRNILSKKGYVVVVLAPPSDQSYGLDTIFRTSDEHATDTKMVIEYLNKRYNQDVYLQGHCRSSFSPSSIATKLNNKGIKGIILSSTRSEGRHGSVLQLQKNVIKVPILLVHHTEDPCDGTPYSNIQKVKSFYESSSPKVDLISVSGGKGGGSSGCNGGHHGFKGQQGSVMDAVVDWLDGNKFPSQINN